VKPMRSPAWKRLGAACTLPLVLLLACTNIPSVESVPLTASERQAILGLSPLVTPAKDSSNAVDGHPAAIGFGAQLFFDKRLSDSGQFSCSTCHDPAKGWTDGKSLAVAAGTGTRNTLSLWNVAQHRWYFWDGRADSLWSQALKPIENGHEMNGSRLQVAKLIATDPPLAKQYEALFGPLPDLSDESRFPRVGGPRSQSTEGQVNWWQMNSADRDIVNRIFANAAKSIAAFEATIVTGDAPFDRFVADLRAGGQYSTAISSSAQRGLKIFVGKGNCVICHSGPNLTNKEFHDIRVPPLNEQLLPDAGRTQGIASLSEDEFVSAGFYSDDPMGPRAQFLFYLNAKAAVRGHFKTPSLRNVADTAPYMHQGQFATLRDVVVYYSTLQGAVDPADPNHVEALIAPLNLNDTEIDDLVAFLQSLTGAATGSRQLGMAAGN
jgi:cytochrome c peroxidase